MYKFCFYVPQSHLAEVKQSVFKVGAGVVDHYDACAWQVKGQGQFRALAGAKPFIGSLNALEYVEEYRVEMLCEPTKMPEIIRAFKAAHPYETPAYDVIKVLDF